MTVYRLRDINTGAIARPPEEFDPNTFRAETGWIIEYEDGEHWSIYRQPTERELKDALVLARLDEIDSLVEEIRQEIESGN